MGSFIRDKQIIKLNQDIVDKVILKPSVCAKLFCVNGSG